MGMTDIIQHYQDQFNEKYATRMTRQQSRAMSVVIATDTDCIRRHRCKAITQTKTRISLPILWLTHENNGI